MADFERIVQIFHAACALSPAERRAYLDEACGEDTRAEVEGLLNHHDGLKEDEEPTQHAAPLSTEREAPPPPVIPGYRIESYLGGGGQGDVWEAVQVRTTLRVALKVLRQGPFVGANSKARFQLEIETLANLGHPNIVRIVDGGVVQGAYYFAMEYIHGKPLHHHVKKAELSPHEICGLLQKICDGIGYAHQNGVVHRDLKPWNILVDEDGEPKVIDFGLAHRNQGQSSAPSPMGLISVTGVIMGTPAYMSPEHASGRPTEIDTRSDVYCIGLILYELLTGGLPYDVTGSLDEIIHNINHAEPRPPSGLRMELDRDVETIVLKALSKEKPRRYDNAVAMAKDLGCYLSGDVLEARRDSTFYVLCKMLRKQRARLAVSAAVLAAVIAVCVSAWFWIERRARQQEDQWQGFYTQAQELLRSPSAGRRAQAQGLLSKAANLRQDVRLRGEAAASLGLWDSRRIALEHVSEKHPDPSRVVWSVALHPEGMIFAAGAPGRAVFWRLPSGKMVNADANWNKAPGRGGAVSFSSDGKLLALGKANGVIEVLDVEDVENTKVKNTLHEPAEALQLAFSLDRRLLAGVLTPATSSQKRPPSAKVWDLGQSPPVTLWEDSAVLALSFSPDDKQLAVGRDEGQIDIYSVESLGQTRNAAAILKSNRRNIAALAWHPEGRLLAGGSLDGSLLLWDTELRQHVSIWSSHPYGVHGLAFSPGGEWLASAGWSAGCTLWQPSSGSKLVSLDLGYAWQYAKSLSVSRDGRFVGCAGEKGLAVCETIAPIGHWKRTLAATAIEKIAFDPSGKHFATLSHDWLIRIWETSTGRLCRLLRAQVSKFADNSSIVFSPKGGHLACTNYQGRTSLWDWESEELIDTWDLPDWGLSPKLSFVDEKSLLLVRHEPDPKSKANWGINVYALRTGQEPALLHSGVSPGTNLFESALIHAGRFHVWFGPRLPPEKAKLRLFDIIDGRELDAQPAEEIKPPDGAPLLPSPDSRFIVVGDYRELSALGNATRSAMYEVREGKLSLVRQWDNQVLGFPSPDGQLIAIVPENVILWDPVSRREIVTLQVGPGLVKVVTWSSDGQRIACGTTEGTVMTFDLGSIRKEISNTIPLLAW